MGKTLFACLIALLLFIPGIASAQKDVKGSKDHPLVGRFADSVIRAYEAKDFDEYTLGLGKLSYRGTDNTFHWAKSEKIEGRITRITYVAPASASTAAIIRSYGEALRKADFKVLFAADEKALGYRYDNWYYKAYPDPQQRRQNLLGFRSTRYLVAKLSRQEGDVYAVAYTAIGGFAARNAPIIQLDVIEVKGLEKGLVTAGGMSNELAKSGRIAIYTLYFDTDKADIKPESEPTLKEIARLIQQDRSLKLYVVGHTDNTGALAHNVDLSQRRAEAIVKTLTLNHGVEAARLRSAGVGPLAPMAPNQTENGRAKNRRVELVAQ